ncbi:MAG: NAD-dependent epimerase/dehydratase family protein [Candidatus Thorarchaeota archaeon]
MKILVTGATGFIGKKLVSSLLQKGHEVTALVRKTSDVRGLPRNLRLIEGDMLDAPSLDAAITGNDVVIHLAAYFDFYPKDVDLLYRVNVEGTRSLIEASVKQGIRRFIYISTTEVIGPVKNPPGTEETELRPQFDYSKSKKKAETILQAASEESDLEYVILRPTGIMGEGDLYTAFEAIEAVNERQIPMLPGDGKKHLMYTYVDDAVRGIVLAVDAKAAANQVIILCPDAPMSYNDLFDFLGQTLGVEPPRRKVPTLLAKIGVGILSPFKNRAKTTFLWHMKTTQSMDEERWFSNAKAKKVLGWTPQLTMQEGLIRTINWYYKEGHLDDKHDN